MKKATTKKRRGSRPEPKGGVVASRPEVLNRFTPEQLAALEARASRELGDEEKRDLDAAADAAYERVETVEAVLRALREARKRRGLTMQEVDERSGIGRSNVSRLESLRVGNPTLETILRYAAAVGVRLRLEVTER